MTFWSFSSSFVAPRSSFGFHVLVFCPALIQTMPVFSTVVAISLEAFPFSSFAAFSSFVSFQRHQLFLDLVQSDRRVITPCFLFLVLGSSSTRIIEVGFFSVARFVAFSAVTLASSASTSTGTGLSCFPLSSKWASLFKARLLKDVSSCSSQWGEF